MTVTRLSLIRRVALAALCIVWDGQAAAGAPAPYPQKAIRLITSSPPGSPPDVVARIFAERIAAGFGQPIVVDNRPGAIGTIALHAIAKASFDGYTLGTLSTPHVLAPVLLPQLPFDMAGDLAPVAQIAWGSHILVVRAASPWTSIKDVIAHAKASPGHLTFASGGNATPAHISGELLKQRTGIDIRHIPYKGAIAGISAVLADQADLMFAAANASGPHIRTGKLRALATPAPQRIEEFADVPTMVELGFRGFEIREWHGLVAPAKTPRALIARIADETARVAASADIKAKLAVLGLTPATDAGPEHFTRLIRAELDRWGKVARTAGLRAD